MEELKYPVGRFDVKQAAPDADERRRLIDSLASTPAQMRSAVEALSEAQLDTPYRDQGWTVRQVVHHVPDSHLNAYIRFKWGLTEDVPLIKTYDEKAWSNLPDAQTAPAGISLDLLSAVHARWDLVLKSMADSDFTRTIRHPEWGEITLATMLRLYEWHGRHHVAHINGVRMRLGWGG
jgi:uncharacterized damage-inducible protein DinB